MHPNGFCVCHIDTDVSNKHEYLFDSCRCENQYTCLWECLKKRPHQFQQLRIGPGFVLIGGMRTIYFETIKLAKIGFIASAIMLPAFVNYNRMPNLTPVDHAERLQYARQILNNKEYLAYAFTNTENGAIESYILSQFEKAFPNSTKSKIYGWVNTLINESNRAGLDPLFVVAIIQQESRFKADIVGSHGEIGLMQIRPKTAAWIAKKNNMDGSESESLFNPDVNIKIGILYLGYLNKKFKNAKHSTAAYNMGPLNVKRIIASNRAPQIYHNQVFRHYKRFYNELNSQKLPLVVAYQ